MRFDVMKAFTVLAICLAAAGTSRAGETVKSGPKVGDFVGPFDVADITGPNKGRILCYRCEYAPDPVVCIFARKSSEPLTALVKRLDGKIGENSKLKSFVVLIPDNAEKDAEQLRKLAKDAGITRVPLTVTAHPGSALSYGIAKDAEVTVLLWKKAEVKVNHAFGKGEMTESDIERIVSELPKILN